MIALYKFVTIYICASNLGSFSQVISFYLKANSTLPFSTVVEHLYGVLCRIFTPRRCRMSNKLFDRLVFKELFQWSSLFILLNLLAFSKYNQPVHFKHMQCSKTKRY